VSSTGDFEKEWKDKFSFALDHGPGREDPALWRLELIKTADEKECALLFQFNHAISDQSSANLLLDQILKSLSKQDEFKPAPQAMPRSLEESILKKNRGVSSFTPNTAQYVAGKAGEGFKSPIILPDSFSGQDKSNSLADAVTTISGKAAGGKAELNDGPPGCAGRQSTVVFRKIANVDALVQKCRDEGVSLTNVLSAAVSLAASEFVGGEELKERNYKVLQSLDMRRFQEDEEGGGDRCNSVGCHAGSMDLMYGPIPDKSASTSSSSSLLWKLAKEGKTQTEKFITNGGPEEAVRVFDFAMEISDMNNLVHLTAVSQSSLGRAYSAGITNNGVYERQLAVKEESEGTGDRQLLESQHEPYQILNLFYATSHARTGCLFQTSVITINNELHLTFHPSSPPIDPEINDKFASTVVDLLEKQMNGVSVEETEKQALTIPSNWPSLVAACYGVYGLLVHSSAWSDFFSQVAAMKASASPEAFQAALNFWIFFAVGHPILQPILYLSDVLHSSPGFRVGGLVPITFLLGNVAFIALLSISKEIRAGVNIFLLSSFLSYVGAGLDGTAGLGDYNLALNDNYGQQVVRGCPAYDEVRQPSMNDFDLQKYQGKWYEQKFHDWTQFKEVYDTTLDIKLTQDGLGWIDDFAVKGPAPKAAVKSWDKSPVANGAHYFLFGRVDPNDPPGVLRESGFGVEFPNYIVDVKKDPATGEYTEAIQFQCLERGGTRVFEGINFMSRKPQMTDEELTAMHARAEKAGMYPYGAGPEQMHSVERRGLDEPEVDNEWQAMWRAIGLDRLLELLAESIEDGGR